MERCKNCNKYTGALKPVSVGEKCEFTITTCNGRNTRHRAVTGKLWSTLTDGYCVSYRGKLYCTETVTHLDDPNPLTLAVVGLCYCPTTSKD